MTEVNGCHDVVSVVVADDVVNVVVADVVDDVPRCCPST